MSIFHWLHGEKNNFSATVDPTVNDDSTQGYVVGSGWINITPSPARIFMLGDATPGAAQWVDVTDSGGDMLQAVYDPTAQSTDAFNQSVGGDLSGTTSAATVTGIRGVNVNVALIKDKEPLTFNASAPQWQTAPPKSFYNLTSQNGTLGINAATRNNKDSAPKRWTMIDYAAGADEDFNWEIHTPTLAVSMTVSIGWCIDVAGAADVKWDVLVSGISDGDVWSNPVTTDSLIQSTLAVDTYQENLIVMPNAESSELVKGTMNITLRRNGANILDTYLSDARVFALNVTIFYL